LIRGYEDDSFKPDNNMTRAEFVAVLNRALGLTDKTVVVFSDVSANAWYADDVEKAQAQFGRRGKTLSRLSRQYN